MAKTDNYGQGKTIFVRPKYKLDLHKLTQKAPPGNGIAHFFSELAKSGHKAPPKVQPCFRLLALKAEKFGVCCASNEKLHELEYAWSPTHVYRVTRWLKERGLLFEFKINQHAVGNRVFRVPFHFWPKYYHWLIDHGELRKAAECRAFFTWEDLDAVLFELRYEYEYKENKKWYEDKDPKRATRFIPDTRDVAPSLKLLSHIPSPPILFKAVKKKTSGKVLKESVSNYAPEPTQKDQFQLKSLHQKWGEGPCESGETKAPSTSPYGRSSTAFNILNGQSKTSTYGTSLVERTTFIENQREVSPTFPPMAELILYLKRHHIQGERLEDAVAWLQDKHNEFEEICQKYEVRHVRAYFLKMVENGTCQGYATNPSRRESPEAVQRAYREVGKKNRESAESFLSSLSRQDDYQALEEAGRASFKITPVGVEWSVRGGGFISLGFTEKHFQKQLLNLKKVIYGFIKNSHEPRSVEASPPMQKPILRPAGSAETSSGDASDGGATAYGTAYGARGTRGKFRPCNASLLAEEKKKRALRDAALWKA